MVQGRVPFHVAAMEVVASVYDWALVALIVLVLSQWLFQLWWNWWRLLLEVDVLLTRCLVFVCACGPFV